ncbi:MAG: thioredoxin domain-containing protein [Acidobacteriota bacterium]
MLLWVLVLGFAPPWKGMGSMGIGQETEGRGLAEVSRPPAHGKPNRLVHEKSPYLLQHAYNPVDWYPWGEEAFDRARKENRPIFLSVGYSTCHWCHVMERESFANPEIAALMNQYFVSIKVDREERPDVDQVYMAFVQATTGGGGWPMSVFLTPGLEPFFGGTYFPPDSRGGRPGFRQVLQRVSQEWNRNRDQILSSAARITVALKQAREASGSGEGRVDKALLQQAYRWYEAAYDKVEGGFGSAPKFPRPVNFNFLLRYYHRTGKKMALEMVAHTLRQMARGGMHDQLGGGFHRYSTDDRWFLPHFEKMLYDQAQLAISYLEAYQLTQDSEFEAVAGDVLDYVLREMTSPEGGFYSAEDADSAVRADQPEEKTEGAFYVWSEEQIQKRLGPDAAIFSFYYGLEKKGNVDQDPFAEFRNKNVLHVAASVRQAAEKFGKSTEAIEHILGSSRRKLFEARTERPRPLRDDKILTAWNGLMISALAKGYQVVGKEAYLRAAEKAAVFISEHLYDRHEKILKRRYREGAVAVEGFLDDYAFLTQGLLDLYETSLEGRWLKLALELTEQMNQLFWDPKTGGYYTASGKDPSILVRMKEDYDGAEPAPNSVAILNLLRLSQISNDEAGRQRAERSIQAFQRQLDASPQAMPQLLVALDFLLSKEKQILIAGKRGAADTARLLEEVHKRFIPNKIIFLADGGDLQKQLAARMEVLNGIRPIDGKATAYICEDYVCQLPTNDPEAVARLLEKRPPTSTR